MTALERLALISDPSAAVAITVATRDKDLDQRDLAARILRSSEFAVEWR